MVWVRTLWWGIVPALWEFVPMWWKVPGAGVSPQSFKGWSVGVSKSQVRSPEQQQCSSFVQLSAADPSSRGDECGSWGTGSKLHCSRFQSRFGWQQVRWKLLMEIQRRLTLLLSFTLYMRSFKVPAFLICGSQLRMLMTLSDGDQWLFHVSFKS